MLAPTTGLEQGRRLATTPRGPTGRTERRSTAQLVPLRSRLLPRQGPKRGLHTGPSPVDRGRAGLKHHLITDGPGTPLAVILTGGNRNDITQPFPLLDAIPPVRAGSATHGTGRTRCSPTAATTTTSTATRSAPAASSLPSLAEAPAMAAGLAYTGGWWSGPLPGSTAYDDSASAGNADPASTKPSSNWPAASSPTGNSSHRVSPSWPLSESSLPTSPLSRVCHRSPPSYLLRSRGITPLGMRNPFAQEGSVAWP
ncbi:hypothetical protein M2157_005955 [Streptomyces sp. SAI-127]|nr:hypothetical protein [Streptomyces sp. SAI-127]